MSFAAALTPVEKDRRENQRGEHRKNNDDQPWPPASADTCGNERESDKSRIPRAEPQANLALLQKPEHPHCVSLRPRRTLTRMAQLKMQSNTTAPYADQGSQSPEKPARLRLVVGKNIRIDVKRFLGLVVHCFATAEHKLDS